MGDPTGYRRTGPLPPPNRAEAGLAPVVEGLPSVPLTEPQIRPNLVQGKDLGHLIGSGHLSSQPRRPGSRQPESRHLGPTTPFPQKPRPRREATHGHTFGLALPLWR